ncbi:MAG: glycosyl hydrolase family 5 [Bacteroidales bacterium]|nr:glycosyl hydrolase family 5 [Bacteroidales bacterium]
MIKMLYIFAAMLLAMSCGPESPEQQENVILSVDKTSMEFNADGGEKTFTVTSSGPFSVLPGEKWITATKGAKDGDKTVVTVTASKTYALETRKTRITITSGDQKRYVEVSQKSAQAAPSGDITKDYAERLGIGWNLGNHFDAYNNGVSGETAWGNPKATQATMNKVKAAGFSTVRIPVTWLGHIGAAPDYKIDEKWLNRVAEVVGYAEAAGLNVIVNMHHDGADSKNWLDIKTAAKDPAVHQQILDQVSAMWGQIADKFKDKGDFLIFEAFNEIHDGGWGWGENRNDGGKQYQCLNEWNQAFVDAVRASGGENANRILGIPAYCTNVDIAVQTFKMPEDVVEGRLIMAVHCYDPYDYTLPATKSEWGHTADESKKVSGNNEADLKRVFEKIYNNFIKKGIPVYMGEFGCVNRATEREQAFQQYYLKYYAKLAKTYFVPSIIWDNGAKGAGNEKHAFIDHGTGEYCSPEAKAAIEALVDSYKNTLSLEDIYNSAPTW